jgi:predicted CXXCH cytochrome family protein
MQGNDFVTSQMYTHGVSCFSCHDVHGTDNNADLVKPENVLCLECHGPNSPNGPHAHTIETHTHHKAGSAGNEFVSCHMPKIEQTIADVNVAPTPLIHYPRDDGGSEGSERVRSVSC